MQGFFSSKQTQSKTRPEGKRYSCLACGLVKNATNSKLPPIGNGKKGILIIGPAPNIREDIQGKLLFGDSSRFLKKCLEEIEIDLFEDCKYVSVIGCHPLNDQKESIEETGHNIACCNQVVLSPIVNDFMPKVIILFGMSALVSIVGSRWKKDLRKIDRWRGFCIPDQELKAWVCPMEDPAHIMKADTQMITIFRQDLARAIKKVKDPFLNFIKPKLEFITDLTILRRIKVPLVAFDYETTGLKPHATGHRIICCALALSPEFAYVFLMPPTKAEREPFIQILESPFVEKTAQNMKYEHAWSLQKLKVEVQNWTWDTMLATHMLDNRPNVSGLKFQCYVQFGIADYSSEITPYLQSSGKDGNECNTIMQLLEMPEGVTKLLTYCGYDAVLEFRLTLLQQKIMNYDPLPF